MKTKTAQTLLYCALALTAWVPARADEFADVSKLAKAGKVVEALNKTNDYLGKHPGDPQMRFMKGVLLTEQNKSDEAIAVFTRLTEDYKDLPEPYNNLAVLYAANGQYDKARAALEKAIRTNPSYQTAYENLGDIYGKMASQAYDKALALGSTSAAPAKSKLTLLRTFSASTGGKIVGAELAVQTPAPAASPVAVTPPASATPPARPAANVQPPLLSQLPPQDAAKAGAPQRIPALSVTPPAAVKPAPAPIAAPAPVIAKAEPAKPVIAPAPLVAKAEPIRPTPAPAPAIAKAEPPKPAPAVVPASAPAPAKPAAPAKPDTSDRDTILAQVNGWAKAWAAQNVDTYLGYYSQQFEPPKGLTRKAWADERRARIEGKGRIHVEIAAPEVSVTGNTARVTFRQTYESDRLTARSRKTLVLVKNGGKWQIKQEISG